jgi:hypothetical protein
MNYGELLAAIESYTENTFPDTTLADGTTVTSQTQLNRFIEQAEQRIYNSVQFPSLRKNMTGSLSTTSSYLSAPDDFLSTYSLAIVSPTTGEYTYLLNKDVNFIREAYPSPTSTGAPKYYALFGPTVASGVISNELSFIVGPKPDANYTVELHYYYYPASISNGNLTTNTTWLGDNFDTVLLYGCLVEAYTYMKGEQDLIALYDTKYKEAFSINTGNIPIVFLNGMMAVIPI